MLEFTSGEKKQYKCPNCGMENNYDINEIGITCKNCGEGYFAVD